MYIYSESYHVRPPLATAGWLRLCRCSVILPPALLRCFYMQKRTQRHSHTGIRPYVNGGRKDQQQEKWLTRATQRRQRLTTTVGYKVLGISRVLLLTAKRDFLIFSFILVLWANWMFCSRNIFQCRWQNLQRISRENLKDDLTKQKRKKRNAFRRKSEDLLIHNQKPHTLC